MKTEQIAVFFYGLFMDQTLLAAKGIRPSRALAGHVDGYVLRIGSRATLVHDKNHKVYGVLMTLGAEDVTALYSEESVADYEAEIVSVALADGTHEAAVCYILPESKLNGTNAQYASALLELAARLNFPRHYLRQIRNQAA